MRVAEIDAEAAGTAADRPVTAPLLRPFLEAYWATADALAALRADPTAFDLLITDLTMPGISGLTRGAAGSSSSSSSSATLGGSAGADSSAGEASGPEGAAASAIRCSLSATGSSTIAC